MQIVILAGGSGTRLWPLSRQLFPKQFLSLVGTHSLIQDTALRVKNFPVHVVTSQETEFLIKNQLKEVLPTFTLDNIFSEPLARNTAPAMAYACQFFPADTVMAVLPADHHIKDTKAFLELLHKAEQLAQKGHIVTFGITPHRPETGYGYIKTGASSQNGAFQVEGFKEKPDLKTAESYVESGDYYWNSGMFVFSVGTMLGELERHAPEVYQVAQNIGPTKPVHAEIYQQFPSLSIDYAVMEKTDKLLLLPANIGWSDIGGFEALQELLPKDSNNNA
ncbi:MAG: mannose-1-phosphate guanylyltransferase/mannose-6-phosphate isomerase, partial [Spirochaetae bacterium HGW-Spirochaetae-6]